MTDKPELTEHFAELGLTRLHYAAAGEGEPMILVPATISLIEDWAEFVRFLAQKFRVHFFELPGYGKSTHFEEGFSSERVAETVERLADSLGLERFVLGGFSFGGILTLKTLKRLSERIDKVVLLSPCVSRRALKHSRAQLMALRTAVTALSTRPGRNGVLKLMHDPRTVDALVWFMTQVGKYETNADLRTRLLGFPAETLDVLLSQVIEVLTVEESDLAGPYPQRCFFGMSVKDPLLDFAVTLDFIEENFADPIVERYDFPYHTPPEPFTFEQLNRDYPDVLDAFERG